MSSCTLDERDRARAAIESIADRPDVLGTDLIDPDTDPTNRWTIEIAIDGDCVPAAIVRELADEELSIRNAAPRQSWWHCVAIVEA